MFNQVSFWTQCIAPHPIYRLVGVLLDCIGKQITISQLVLAGRDATEGKALTMWDLKVTFDDLGVFMEGLRVDHEALSYLSCPFIAQIDNCDHPIFVVISDITESHVTWFDGSNGWLTTPRDQFTSRWLGPVLLPKRAITTTTRDYELALADEALAHDEFEEGLATFEDFLTPEECEALIRIASKRWQMSRVGALHSDGEVSDFRTSRTAMLSKEDHAEWVRQLTPRLSALMPAFRPELVDPLQCISYGVTQEFKAHFDLGPQDAEETRSRQWTVLVYLNDNFEGGETYFPMLDRSIIPRRGMALRFPNRRASGKIHAFSLHAGRPVHAGTKYACNIWISAE